jgi:hypothetical protein
MVFSTPWRFTGVPPASFGFALKTPMGIIKPLSECQGGRDLRQAQSEPGSAINPAGMIRINPNSCARDAPARLLCGSFLELAIDCEAWV